jgi:hypothetical protein
MPIYGSATPLTLTTMGVAVWNNEAVPTAPANQSVSIPIGLKRNTNAPNCLSVEVSFAANPGAFAIDLQTSDTDSENYYVTKATLNTGLSATFTGRIEATNIVAKFARLKMVTKTNAVNVSAKFF